MTYFRDLSRYTYSNSPIPDINVGWLSRWRPFIKGSVPAEVIGILKSQAKIPRNPMRGSHSCPFCAPFRIRGRRVSCRTSKTEFNLGSAEIHVFSRSGEVFSAPNLVYHYVERHGYRPPDEFLQAVMEGAEGPVESSTVRRLRELVKAAPRLEDRVDAAIDLMQISPEDSVPWLKDVVDLPSCHPYFKQRLISAIKALTGTTRRQL